MYGFNIWSIWGVMLRRAGLTWKLKDIFRRLSRGFRMVVLRDSYTFMGDQKKNKIARAFWIVE